MKTYTLNSSIIDEDGNLVATIEDREIAADEVIELLAKGRTEEGVAVPEVRTKRGRPSKTAATPPMGKQKRSRKEPCGECGSKGSRHFKTCSQNGVPATKLAKSSSAGQRQHMSQMTFGRLKISQSHEVTAEKAAKSFDLPLSEVEIAFLSETYTDYQEGI